MTVRLRSRLPDDQADGLQAVARSLVDDRTQTLIVVMAVSVRSVTENIGDDDNPHDVTLRIDQVEVIGAEDRGQVRMTMLRAREDRTGRMILPGMAAS